MPLGNHPLRSLLLRTRTAKAWKVTCHGAGLLAAGYDYDGAIAMLSESPYASDEQVKAAIAGYEENKTALVRADPKKVTHVFFHSLIIDTSKAFDGRLQGEGL